MKYVVSIITYLNTMEGRIRIPKFTKRKQEEDEKEEKDNKTTINLTANELLTKLNITSNKKKEIKEDDISEFIEQLSIVSKFLDSIDSDDINEILKYIKTHQKDRVITLESIIKKQNIALNQLNDERKEYTKNLNERSDLVKQLTEELEKRKEDLCIICMDTLRNIVLFPCRHLQICDVCKNKILLVAKPVCPTCRTEIEGHIKVIL